METTYTTLIERYFDEQLSDAEVAELDTLRETDIEVQREFELFEKSHKAIRLLTISDLKQEVKEIREQKKTASTPVRSLGWMKVAASILLLAVVGLGFFAQQFSNDKLYDNAFAPADDYITNMDAEMSALEKAMELYNTEKYAEAIEAFAAIEGENPKNQEAKFYLGQSLMQAGQDEQAIKALTEVSGEYHPEALWYAALIELKSGNEVEALDHLDHIIEEKEDEAFMLKAQELKDKLSSPLRKLVF